MKLFSKEKDRFHDIYRIFGIKFKLLNKNYLKSEICDFEGKVKLHSWKRFYYASTHMTIDEKIRALQELLFDRTKEYPNIKYPRTFNEKLNWLRFNYNNPMINVIEDKYEFKKYITDKLGEEYVTKLYKVYDDINDINFDELPDRFVIKSTQSAGAKGVRIVRDKNKCDFHQIKYDISKSMNSWNKMYFYDVQNGEKIRERIIVEEYLEQMDKSACDYKFFCFNGEPKAFYIANNWALNKENKQISYYDINKNELSLKYGHYGKEDLKLNIREETFKKMVDICKILSKDFPFVRVDFYDTGDRVLVGELTFTPTGGYGKYTPREWDYKLGELLDLSKIPEENLKILPEFAEGAKTFIDPDVVDRCTVRNNQMENNVCVCK